MKSLASTADFNSHQVLVRPFSDTIYNIKVSASSESHITIPTGSTRVILGGTAIYYVKIGPAGTTAAIPSVNVTDGSGSAILSFGYSLAVTDTVISIISPSACIVSLEFYS